MCSNNNGTTPSTEYVVSHSWPWSAATAAAAAGWHSPDHIISAISTFLMDLSFLSRCTRSGHLIIIIWWWCSGDFMVGVCRESGRLIFCKLVLGASEYSPCAFHLQELCRVLCRVVEGGVALPSQASLELLVPVHLLLLPDLQPPSPQLNRSPTSNPRLLLVLPHHEQHTPTPVPLSNAHSCAFSLSVARVQFSSLPWH